MVSKNSVSQPNSWQSVRTITCPSGKPLTKNFWLLYTNLQFLRQLTQAKMVLQSLLEQLLELAELMIWLIEPPQDLSCNKNSLKRTSQFQTSNARLIVNTFLSQVFRALTYLFCLKMPQKASKYMDSLLLTPMFAHVTSSKMMEGQK